MALICISLLISHVEQALFHIPVGHLYVFFGKMSVKVLRPFLNQVPCFLDIDMYKLFVYLNVSPLLVMSFEI